MNDRSFAIESLHDYPWKEFVRFEFSGFRITPLEKDERPSTILRGCPINCESGEVESRIKTNQECFRLNSEAQDFAEELGTGINANMCMPIICSFCFVPFRKFDDDIDFFVTQFTAVIQKNSFLKRDVSSLSQFTEAPASEA